MAGQDIVGDSLPHLINLTDAEMKQIQRYHVIKYYTFMTISIALLSIGVPGNILTIIVLKQRDMKDAVFSTYMISLCVTNILVLIWCVPSTIVNAVLHRDVYFTNPDFCRFYRTLGFLFVCYSCWHLVLITGIRLCYLLDKNKICTCLYNAPLKTVFTMMVILTCWHTPFLLLWFQVKNERGETVECYAPSTSVHAFTQMIVPTLLIALLLIILNVWIYCLHRRNTSGLSDRAHSTSTIKKRLFYLVFVSSAQFLISWIPISCWPPIAPLVFDVNTVVGQYYLSFGNNICALVLFTNNSCNFIIYCFVGRRFRLQLFKLITHWTRCIPISCFKGVSSREFSTDVHLTFSSPNETDDVTSMEQSKALKVAGSKHDDILEAKKKPSESNTIWTSHRFRDLDDDPLHGLWGTDALTTSSADDGSVHMYTNAKKSMMSMSAASRRTCGTD